MNYLCSVFVQRAEIQGSVLSNAVLQGRTKFVSACVTVLAPCRRRTNRDYFCIDFNQLALIMKRILGGYQIFKCLLHEMPVFREYIVNFRNVH